MAKNTDLRWPSKKPGGLAWVIMTGGVLGGGAEAGLVCKLPREFGGGGGVLRGGIRGSGVDIRQA